jgi:REP element-mobilizing transposase RayT
VVFIPKRRQKLIYGKLRKYLGEIFHELAKRRGVEIVEGHMMMDHVHMCISIPPKYSVANTVGYIKGKSAIAIIQQSDIKPHWAMRSSTEMLLDFLSRKVLPHQLYARGKNKNVVVVAIARELVAFMWDIAHHVHLKAVH